jgi:hypothetical protein
VEVPYAIEDGDAVRVTVGPGAELPRDWFDEGEVVGVSNVVDPTPPPQEAKPETANNTAKMTLNMTFILAALMWDMINFLHLNFEWALQDELFSSRPGRLISFAIGVRLAG